MNTIQPQSQPRGGGARLPRIDDAQYPNIGDRLTAAGISWNWYAGGWDDAAAGNPGDLFQFHHQPFNYFANYAPGTPGRAHLQDETDFIAAAQDGTLPTVSFVKPYGEENEHPGYASESERLDHLVDLLQAVKNGAAGRQHAGRRDLRRVRRPVGPRGSRRPSTTWGPGHPHPGPVVVAR